MITNCIKPYINRYKYSDAALNLNQFQFRIQTIRHRTMAIFVTLKKYLRWLGFFEFENAYGRKIGIALSIFVPFVVVSSLIMTACYQFMEENTNIHKRIQSGSSVMAMSYVATAILLLLFKKQTFFGLIGVLEDQIQRRESRFSRPIYRETSAKFDSLTGNIIIFMNLIVGFVLHIIFVSLISYYNYYFNDMGEAAFIMIVPSK